MGSLWTAGVEAFRYGDAPNSYLVYMNNPRWRQGHHNVQFEAQRVFRVRSLPGSEKNADDEYPTIQTDILKAQVRLLAPVLGGRDPQWADSPLRLGLELGYYRGRPTVLGDGARVDFNLRGDSASSLWVSAMAERDGLKINYLDYDGFKWAAKVLSLIHI